MLPAASAVTAPATIVSNTPLAFATTNGDVLAVRTIDVSGQVVAVFGGDFSTVKTQDGVTHSAANLAAVNETTGALVFAAGSTSENGYVRALAYQAGVLYVGGSFTTFNGTARSHLLALAVPGWTLTTWKPTTSDFVESLDADAAGVYVGGAFGLIKDLSPSTGATIWSDPVVGGGVRALLADDANGGLYAAGFFDSVGTENNHGMVELNLATGAPIPTFAPVFQPNDGIGAAGAFDGEDPMDLALNTTVVPNELLMGSGGQQNFVRMLNLTTGANIWDHETPGDAQAVAMVGTSALVGYHRNRPNSSTFPYPYYAAQLGGTNGAIGAWQAGLSGFPPQIPDGGNNGVRGLAYNPTTNILVVVGAFTTYGATCSPATTTTCTGGTKLNSIAAYQVDTGQVGLPLTPSAPTVSDLTSTSTELTWPAVSGATSYNLQRTVAGTSGVTTVASGLTSTSFEDTGLTPGTQYSYQVIALNIAGSSPASPAIDVTTPLADTATTLAAPTAAKEGHRLSLVATETADPTGSAAGTVVFTDKTKVLGSVSVSAADGTATLKTPKLLPGKHTFRAAFTPTDPETYGSSTSGAHKLTVVKIALANTLRPHLAGPHHKRRAIVGTTEKASHGKWSPKATSYSYRWYLGAHRIKGATGPSVLLKASYRGKRLSCVVRAKRKHYLVGVVRTKRLTVKA